jgi:hypothetical protein
MPELSYKLHHYDFAMIRLLREIKDGLDKTHLILGQIQKISVVHGGTTRQVSEPKIVDTEMRRFSSLVTAGSEWISKTEVPPFVDLAFSLWEEFSTDAEKYLFETVGKTSEAVGNVHDAQGQNIWDAQIEALKKLPMRFDKDGNHNTKFYFGPKETRGARELVPPPEQQKRIDEVINAKREEYYAQKRTRRLS